MDWKEKLSPEEYEVLREKATEPPFSGRFNDWKAEGTYVCAACGNPLFHSDQKYDSGSGWPSFWDPIHPTALHMQDDHGRIEVTCNQCLSHLGHVFNDGPPPTGKRYCINSVALNFKAG